MLKHKFNPIRLKVCYVIRHWPASCEPCAAVCVMSWPGSPCLRDMNALAASGGGGDLWGAGTCGETLATDQGVLSASQALQQIARYSVSSQPPALVTCPLE